MTWHPAMEKEPEFQRSTGSIAVAKKEKKMKGNFKRAMPLALGFLMVFFLVTASVATAKKPSDAAAKKTSKTELADEAVMARFGANFTAIKAESISKSPIAGVYEIVANRGSLVLYYAPGPNLVLFGDLLGKDMKSLTAEKRNSIQQAKYREIPLDKAIKIGSGKHIVIEFTDPDCPYCRKASEYFKDKDVTKYVFLRPIVQLHPKAEEKSKYILGSSNPVKAYYDVMGGKMDALPDQSVPPEVMAKLAAQADVANRLGVSGTPMFWVDGKYVAGANFAAIDAILKK